MQVEGQELLRQTYLVRCLRQLPARAQQAFRVFVAAPESEEVLRSALAIQPLPQVAPG